MRTLSITIKENRDKSLVNAILAFYHKSESASIVHNWYTLYFL
jgi:hypothetical protein